MPVADAVVEETYSTREEPLSRLPFPPITSSHILHCSYHDWHPRYRTITPKARLIPLSKPFVNYLRADGIVLPDEDHEIDSSTDTDSGIFSASTSTADSDSEDEEPDPSLEWLDIHHKIKETIKELKGSVHPKLNWSAPKDATWIATTNSMECRTANDVYLLLKSSDFITHDLEQAFDGCEDASSADEADRESIPYHLVLRQTIPALVTSLEFRCFVRRRELLCMCQRDLNHYTFLPGLLPKLRARIQGFFAKSLQHSFSDENFVFDIYIPPPHERVWLIDINPWAPRTDPLLFSWLEILRMRGPHGDATVSDGFLENAEDWLGSLHLRGPDGKTKIAHKSLQSIEEEDENAEGTDKVADEGTGFVPEFRLVNRDDPEAYSFNTPQYSAHKLPKDVVDACGDGEAGLRDFMGQWRDILKKQEEETASLDERDHDEKKEGSQSTEIG